MGPQNLISARVAIVHRNTTPPQQADKRKSKCVLFSTINADEKMMFALNRFNKLNV